MDAWAGKYGSRAAFVCVSCAGPPLAEQFGKDLKLSRCTLTYAEHFGFEEELLDLHLYEDVIAPPEQGAPSFNADRNARTSHFADHAKQLEGVRKQLGALSEADASGSSSRSAAVVPVAFVDQVLRAFESHASRYDNYGERLAAALPETPD